MIVIDASALLELLLRTPKAGAVSARIARVGETLHAPHLVDVEIAQVLRRFVLAGRIAAKTGYEALLDLSVFPLTRYPMSGLVLRGWALRENVTAYDASYVALADVLGAPLLTRDQKLASAVAGRAVVEVV